MLLYTYIFFPAKLLLLDIAIGLGIRFDKLICEAFLDLDANMADDGEWWPPFSSSVPIPGGAGDDERDIDDACAYCVVLPEGESTLPISWPRLPFPFEVEAAMA